MFVTETSESAMQTEELKVTWAQMQTDITDVVNSGTVTDMPEVGDVLPRIKRLHHSGIQTEEVKIQTIELPTEVSEVRHTDTQANVNISNFI